MAEWTDLDGTVRTFDETQIHLGDIGYVRGKRGSVMVCSGAPNLPYIVPCSDSAKHDAIPSETLGLSDGSICSRAEWIPSHLVTADDWETCAPVNPISGNPVPWSSVSQS